MKPFATLPVAVVAVFLFPRIKQELEPRGELSQLEKSVARQQAAKKDLEKLRARVRSGEKVSLETLFPKSEGPKSESTLLNLRQDVVALQEEFEEMNRNAFAAPEAEEEASSEPKAPEIPKANPLVKPDRARLGGALFRAGKFEEALAALENEKDPWSGFLTASCKERLGRAEEAVADYEKISEAFPQSAAGKQAKAVSEYLKKRNKLGKTADYDAQLAEMAAELLQQSVEPAPVPATPAAAPPKEQKK